MESVDSVKNLHAESDLFSERQGGKVRRKSFETLVFTELGENDEFVGFLDLKKANSLEKIWMVELFHNRKFSIKAIGVFSVFGLLDSVRLGIAVFHTLNSPICAFTYSHFGFEEFVEFGLGNCSGLDVFAKYFLGLAEQVVRVGEFSAHGLEMVWEKINKSDYNRCINTFYYEAKIFLY